MQKKWLIHLVTFTACLAFFVVMLGAYTRLTNAGLGCPDWPGCYGHMVLPSATGSLDQAQNNFPHIPIETRKAWTEMIHRYAAGTLALSIFFIAGYLLWKRAANYSISCVKLILLVSFQALLGMWTVTLKLLPVVVMGHLLGGILIFSLLCRLRLQLCEFVRPELPNLHKWIVVGAVIVFIQIALGGWVSANYAGLACVGFPQCNGHWLPNLHFSKGFYLFSAIGENYQGGVLDSPARVTIQYIHRLGAMVTLAYLVSLATFILIKANYKPLRMVAGVSLVLVLTQFTLGIMNVIYLLPLKVAVAHNGVAALLMATLFMMLHLGGSRHES